MHNLLLIFQASLKLAAELLITFIGAFVFLVVREIYESFKKKGNVYDWNA